MKKSDPNIWRVQREWEGQTVVIIAGGPSVTPEQIEYVHKSGHKTIVVNNAYLLAPWADILYGCDARWWKWHKGAEGFKGRKVCLRYYSGTNDLEGDWTEDLYPDILSLTYEKRNGISIVPGLVVSGKDSSYQAVQLAIQLGAKHIILVGCDCKSEQIGLERDEINSVLDTILGENYSILKREAIAETIRDIQVHHWHGQHPDGSYPPFDIMIKFYKTMVPDLEDLGIKVVNCSPDSALTMFRQLSIEEAI